MKLETERLLLRELAPEDFDALYAVLAGSDIMLHYPLKRGCRTGFVKTWSATACSASGCGQSV